jgi:hypothetical protein
MTIRFVVGYQFLKEKFLDHVLSSGSSQFKGPRCSLEVNLRMGWQGGKL